MMDLAVGLGVALVLEGLLWALAPDFARRMLADISRLPNGQISAAAWGFVAAGLVLVWLIRG